MTSPLALAFARRPRTTTLVVAVGVVLTVVGLATEKVWVVAGGFALVMVGTFPSGYGRRLAMHTRIESNPVVSAALRDGNTALDKYLRPEITDEEYAQEWASLHQLAVEASTDRLARERLDRHVRELEDRARNTDRYRDLP